MADKRKDKKGRNLKNGESIMPDGRYRFQYTDKTGKRTQVYSWKLVSTDKVPQGKRDCISLRQMEKQIEKDLEEGIDSVLASNTTLNDMFDKYIGLKTHLKESTRVNYIYNYDHFIREVIGNRKIKSFKYSDIKAFYNGLLKDGMKINTLDNIHTLLHPTFTLAVRDGIIRNNPTDGVCAELKKGHTKSEQRHALTIDEQRLFMDFLKESKVYNHWLPLFTFILGTGCRVGEVIGIRWTDIDFIKNTISINHNTSYRPDGKGSMVLSVSTPKTDAGCRTIPLFKNVREALLKLKQQQMQLGSYCELEVDGYTDFVFINRYGNVLLPHDINRAIVRIYTEANAKEAEQAKKERRSPVVIRHFSVHNLRHTFCTRLCEVENNIKLIMSIMGHSDVQTTMNIYNEIQEAKKKEAFTELNNKIMIS